MTPYRLILVAALGLLLLPAPATAQPAGDPLCAKYAGVVVGMAQGKPVSPDCAGLRNMANELTGLLAQLGDAMADLSAHAATRPFSEILAGDPLIARQCQRSAAGGGALYACQLSAAMIMTIPVGAHGRAERVRVDFDIEKHVQARLARPGVTVHDVIYDIYRDMLAEARGRGGRPLPLTVSGKRAVLDVPIGK